MATRGDLRTRALATLRAAAVPSAALDADVLLAHVVGVGREALVAHPEATVAPEVERRYDALVARRAKGEPVAYLRGYKEFYGVTFGVDPRVLVPRPETEALVDAVRAFAAGRPLTVVDLGTGSGAVAIALARHEPALRIIATDVSAAALAVARENAAANGLAARIEFRLGDLLAPIDAPVDVLVANLPYLRADALDDLTGDRSALAFEPRLATVSGTDGLDLIRRAATDLGRVLADGGAAFFECDPPQAAAVAGLLAPYGATRVIADLAGNERVVAVERRTTPPRLELSLGDEAAAAGDQRGSVGTVHTRSLVLPDPLPLDSGRSLHPVTIAYETYGALSDRRDNAILVCHALSGDAHAAGWSDDPAAPSAVDGVGAAQRSRGGLGWWDGMIGPGKAFDTDRYFVVCSNLIGSCRGSTGPASPDPATGRPYGAGFPVVTVADMVRAERAFLRELGIERLFAVTGGSLGGMQALEWAVAYPEAVRAIVPIASTAALGAQGVAWNAIARNAITSDPDWQGGSYAGTGRTPAAGIKLARMVGHITYLSDQAVREKFARRFQDRSGPSYDLVAAEFEVESYLRHQAETFAARFDANAYLYISRALTYFDLARSYGAGSLRDALARVRAATLLLSFSSDWLYPPRDSEEIAVALRANGQLATHVIIEAAYGHDSFLLEEGRMTEHIAAFFERVHRSAA